MSYGYTYGNPGYGGGPYGGGGAVFPLPVSYYTNLLTSEYKLAPNLNAWLAAKLQPFANVNACLASMNEAFDLDYAVGVQLDVLGQIQGVSRTVGFQPSGSVSPVLDDTTYRLLIKATIANNLWQGTESELYPIWQTLFPGGRITIIDNQNMTCTIVLSGTFTSIVQDLISHGYIVPRPEGVLYTYVFSNLPIFGFDEDNSFIAGLDVGYFS
jgi:hypothetical protein